MQAIRANKEAAEDITRRKMIAGGGFGRPPNRRFDDSDSDEGDSWNGRGGQPMRAGGNAAAASAPVHEELPQEDYND